MIKPLTVLPFEFQNLWMASLQPTNQEPAFRLVDIHKTKPKGFQELKIIVRILDLNGFPMPNQNVAFSYTTASSFVVPDGSIWLPPLPRKADIFQTEGGGQIEHVQGSTVRQGEPGGVTVYVFEPTFAASDVVTGMGALPDHTGVLLTFQYFDSSQKSIWDRLDELEKKLNV